MSGNIDISTNKLIFTINDSSNNLDIGELFYETVDNDPSMAFLKIRYA